ncbi:MAG: hypothetical protein RL414_228, partial [Actinomycetota bacterium]
LTEEAERIGGNAMHQRLATLDPAAAAAIPKENIRRVVRALEVIELTGKPFTANLPRKDSTRYPQAQQFGLAMDRATLDARIDARVEKMWELGIESELDQLISEGLLEGTTAQAALGYSQLIAARNGISSDPKTETKIATRQYARRQETWFTRDERIKWLEPASTSDHLRSVLATIIKS